jgi:hypothetical protein
VIGKADGLPREAVTLRMEWDVRFHLQRRGGTSVEREGAGTTTLEDGRFTLCGIPIDMPLRLATVRDGRSTPAARLRLRDRNPYFVEVEVR